MLRFAILSVSENEKTDKKPSNADDEADEQTAIEAQMQQTFQEELQRGKRLLDIKREAFHPRRRTQGNPIPEPMSRMLFSIPIFHHIIYIVMIVEIIFRPSLE